MNFFEFITEFFWPAVALIIFFELKDDIRNFISKIEAVKHGKTTISIAEDIKKIKDDIANQSSPKSLITSEKLRDGMKDAEQSVGVLTSEFPDPKMLVLEAWISFELTLRNLFLSHKSDLVNLHYSRASSLKLIDELVEKGAISANDAMILHEIRQLRNRIVHEGSVVVSKVNAKYFAETLESIRISLEKVKL